jgi:hypothetical protein
MTRWTVPKASLAGIGVFVVGQVLYVIFSYHELLRLVLLGAPGFAAFVAAYLAPRRKMAVGMSMAIRGDAWRTDGSCLSALRRVSGLG